MDMVLTFRDEEGREWLAGAEIGPLLRFEDKSLPAVEAMEPDKLKDRAFSLVRITAIDRT